MNKSVVTHSMRLANFPFEQIASGKKTVEVRLNDEKRQKLAVGDNIQFTRVSDGARVLTRIVGLTRFDTFLALYSSELFDKCGCFGMTAEQATEYIYGYYTPDQEAAYGALAIEIEVLR